MTEQTLHGSLLKEGETILTFPDLTIQASHVLGCRVSAPRGWTPCLIVGASWGTTCVPYDTIEEARAAHATTTDAMVRVAARVAAKS